MLKWPAHPTPAGSAGFAGVEGGPVSSYGATGKVADWGRKP